MNGGRRYLTDDGDVIRVREHRGRFASFREVDEFRSARIRKRRYLLWRQSREVAQLDLDLYAKSVGWTPVPTDEELADAMRSVGRDSLIPRIPRLNESCRCVLMDQMRRRNEEITDGNSD